MRKALLPVALAGLFLTACSPVTVNTAPSVVTVTAESNSTEAAAPSSSSPAAPVTVTATATETTTAAPTPEPSPVAEPVDADEGLDPWVIAINDILGSGAATQLYSMDSTGCIEKSGSRKSSWNDYCLTELDKMAGTAGSLLDLLELHSNDLGAPSDPKMRAAVKDATDFMDKQVENLTQASIHECLAYADPQRKIPRVKDGKATECFYFYTNDYWEKAAAKLGPFATS